MKNPLPGLIIPIIILLILFSMFFASCSHFTSKTGVNNSINQNKESESVALRSLPSTDDPLNYPISGHYGMKIEENPLPPLTENDIRTLNYDEKKLQSQLQFTLSYHDSGRDALFMPFRMMTLMGLKPGDTIADIGAGSGYFAFRFSKVVGEKGKVYVVDHDELMVKIVNLLIEKNQHTKYGPYNNMKAVLNDNQGIYLPDNCLDYAFVGWTGIYGHMDYYTDMGAEPVLNEQGVRDFFCEKTKNFTQSIYKSLKQEGRLVIIDEKKGINKDMDNWDEGTIEIMEKNGFELERKYNYMQTVFFLIFKKKA